MKLDKLLKPTSHKRRLCLAVKSNLWFIPSASLSCLDSPPHSLSAHRYYHHHSHHPLLLHSFTPGSKPIPFQQILPILDFFYLPDCLHDTGLDRTYHAHRFIFSFTFNFLFIPCGRLSWLPDSFLLHVKYTLSYRIIFSLNSYGKVHIWAVTEATKSLPGVVVSGDECSDSDDRSDRPSTPDIEVRGRGKVTRSWLRSDNDKGRLVCCADGDDDWPVEADSCCSRSHTCITSISDIVSIVITIIIISLLVRCQHRHPPCSPLETCYLSRPG